MKRLILSLIILVLLITPALAEWNWNPFDGHLDYYDATPYDQTLNTTDDVTFNSTCIRNHCFTADANSLYLYINGALAQTWTNPLVSYDVEFAGVDVQFGGVDVQFGG